MQELSTITLSIQLNDRRFNNVDSGLPIDRLGFYKLHVLTARSYSKTERLATFEVESKDSYKLIKIRSNILLKNHTKEAFKLNFESSDTDPVELELPVNELIPVPILFVFNGKLTLNVNKQKFV